MVKIAFVLISGDILKMRDSKEAEALRQRKCVYFLGSFEIVCPLELDNLFAEHQNGWLTVTPNQGSC